MIQYEPPRNAEDYIHRCGCTGRAGEDPGLFLSFGIEWLQCIMSEIPAFESIAEELLNTSGLYAENYWQRPLLRLLFLPEEKVESLKGMKLITDGKGECFEVAAEIWIFLLVRRKSLV
ncbi:putative RNA helicase [Rosa chinensis]|uniref:Putative RNA helicase n=1 Tax=Rosa chinensis TaxID=74649 RepID=A0A2P6QIY4_ROSCH|nr:putative RNA helicase [Rosa chinensis]